MTSLGVVGMVGRFKPVHKGHAVMLEAVCANAEYVYIGIGSPNKYDARNPFTAKESREMIDAVLRPRHSNYSFIEVPDFDDGPVWRGHTLKLFGRLDCFVTSNDYVVELLKKDYKIVHPFEIISHEKFVPVTATIVRNAIAKGDVWEQFVPEPVVVYIKDNGLDKRFKREFGKIVLSGSS